MTKQVPPTILAIAILASFSGAIAADVTTVDEAADLTLGNKYLYCGILINQIDQMGGGSGSTKRGNFMLAMASQLLGGNKTLEEIKPNIDAAKEQISRDIKAPNISFEKLSDCIDTDKKNSAALFERFKDAMSKNVKQ